jgi:dienelactone hydrolase
VLRAIDHTRKQPGSLLDCCSLPAVGGIIEQGFRKRGDSMRRTLLTRGCVLAVGVLLVTLLWLHGACFAQDHAPTPLSSAQARAWRAQIRQALFVPDPLPHCDLEIHGRFEPAPGIVAERVSYGTQFGLRVPAILYLPQAPSGPLPALIVVNGHGGDKYSWYAFYSGILYARAGAAVLTYDPIGEGERNVRRASGTRAHDAPLDPPEMAQRLGGLMVTDVLQAVSCLSARPEVDPRRIGAMGYSMGSFIVALAGAVDDRLKVCVLTGGGNLDGPDGYWDNSKPMCQGLPYQSLRFLGDRPAAIYALHAVRGPTLIVNGLNDSVVAIPTHGADFFADLRRRTVRRHGGEKGVFEHHLIPDVSHRPFFVTPDVALWLEEQIDFPHWTETDIRAMPTTHIGEWSREHNVALDRLYATEEREGGTRALGTGIPGLARNELSVLAPEEWEQLRTRLVYESWVEKARQAAAE